jgi:hypothetical protein
VVLGAAVLWVCRYEKEVVQLRREIEEINRTRKLHQVGINVLLGATAYLLVETGVL